MFINCKMKRLTLIIGMLYVPSVCRRKRNTYPRYGVGSGNGTYRNPVLHADYSDPDVCAAGDDFYMTASSFGCTPGCLFSIQGFGELAYYQLCLEGAGAERVL